MAIKSIDLKITKEFFLLIAEPEKRCSKIYVQPCTLLVLKSVRAIISPQIE